MVTAGAVTVLDRPTQLAVVDVDTASILIMVRLVLVLLVVVGNVVTARSRRRLMVIGVTAPAGRSLVLRIVRPVLLRMMLMVLLMMVTSCLSLNIHHMLLQLSGSGLF